MDKWKLKRKLQNEPAKFFSLFLLNFHDEAKIMEFQKKSSTHVAHYASLCVLLTKLIDVNLVIITNKKILWP